MSKSDERTESQPVIGEALLHPIAVLSVAVLLLNDHWLKARFPGFVTGKLSDLAGMVFFPLLLLTLFDAVSRMIRNRSGLHHRALLLCVAMTGLVFVAVKTTDVGAESFRHLWAIMQWPARAIAAHRIVPIGRVRLVQDTTDLIALPLLVVAYGVGRRAISHTIKH